MWQSHRSALREPATKRPPHSPNELSALDTLNRLPGQSHRRTIDILIYENSRQVARPAGRTATPKLNYFNLLIENLVASENSEACKTPSSRVNQAPAPTPLSPYGAYLSNCVNKLKPKCGEQIFFSVIVGNQTVSRYCCTSLVKDMGQTCHTDVTRYAADLPEHKNNKREILNSRTVRMFNISLRCGQQFGDYEDMFDIDRSLVVQVAMLDI
ncbi:hypothetical protein DEO72_LG5g2351 [Vigna unguiculata]|uniref:Prolamin-like domain-containing protein n=1 Tax=Vigna unguiculata TaxID=3917 RepID=A0A4D6M100_VIGUN|nr:hypothetical protein DEO72_LG5g2351 [Vigna unguiculata]